MADRGRGAARGGTGRGSSTRGRGPQGAQASQDKPQKREAILNPETYIGKRIHVKFTGGREVTGILKGHDQLLNLVLDDVEETLQEPKPYKRKLGLVVLRGPTITLINPVEGFSEIDNPFTEQQ